MDARGVFLKLDLRAYTSPIVYKAYLKDILVYIGASSVGLSRISTSHHVLKHLLKLDGFSLEYTICSSREEAFRLESELIKTYKPLVNIVGVRKRKQGSLKHEQRLTRTAAYKNALDIKVAK